VNRLAAALIAYVVLAVLTWTTITDPKFRAGTLVILALFAFKSWVRRNDVMHPDKSSGADDVRSELKAKS
jgi:membrane protein required for beta-lactamase induction